MATKNNQTDSAANAVRAPTAAAALTIVLFLVLTIVAGLLVWQTYRDTIMRAETRAESAAHVVAAHVQWLVEASEQALRRVDEALGARPDTFIAGTVGELDDAVAGLPGRVTVWVFDAEGNSLLTNDPDFVEVNVSDRDYYQALAAGESWHITPLLTGKTTASKVFAIGRRIERNGDFLGIAVIAVPAGLMAEFWRPLDLGPDSSVGLIRDDGWLVARHPVPEDTMDLSEHILFTEYLQQAPEGSYSYPASPADGIGRIVGYRRVENAPLVAVAGISRDAALSGFWSRMAVAGAVAAPIAVALLMMSLWVVVLLRRDEQRRRELAAAVDHNRFLFREIHHRVKNNLQTVSSLIRMQPGPPEAKEEMSQRLAAMAAVHEHIYRSDQFAFLNLADYLAKLLDELKASHATAISVEHRLAPLEIDADRALSIGLIVNEVVSNAFKHAFADACGGTISVEMDAVERKEVRLCIRDDGVGFEEGENLKGMGGRLIKALTQQIGGSFAFHRDGGTSFVLTFPL